MQGTQRSLTSSGGTAKTLILIGVIFRVIFALIFLFGLGLLAVITSPTGVGLILARIWLVFGFIDFIFLFPVYSLCYRRTVQGAYGETKTPTLIFGIPSLIFGASSRAFSTSSLSPSSEMRSASSSQ